MCLFSPAGQSQWSCLVLVAARRPAIGESSPAHHPVHDLPQGPPHCHPQGPHIRHAQEAAVNSQPLGRQTRTVRASMHFSSSFIRLFSHSFVHVVTRGPIHRSIYKCVPTVVHVPTRTSADSVRSA